MAIAVVGSLVVGCAVVWAFAPRAFRPLTTAELLMVMGLMLLPLATVWAILAERRCAAGRAESRQAHVPPVVMIELKSGAMGAASKPAAARVQTHPPAPRHPRLEPHQPKEVV